jgi:hypothetical protein
MSASPGTCTGGADKTDFGELHVKLSGYRRASRPDGGGCLCAAATGAEELVQPDSRIGDKERTPLRLEAMAPPACAPITPEDMAIRMAIPGLDCWHQRASLRRYWSWLVGADYVGPVTLGVAYVDLRQPEQHRVSAAAWAPAVPDPRWQTSLERRVSVTAAF